MDKYLHKLRALNLSEPIVVVGMGVSGASALDVLREAGYDAIGCDEHKSGRHIQRVNLDQAVFTEVGTLVVSPGIDRRRRAFVDIGADVVNDIELFARVVEKPVVAVTGSNGKSTVVTLLTEALQALGQSVRLCGNIGTPVMDALLDAPQSADYYVLELSSYQLELCPSLTPAVGAIVNISPDHLDRYDSFADYCAAKAKLAWQSQVVVLNADDDACRQLSDEILNPVFFGTAEVEKHRVQAGQIIVDNQPILQAETLLLSGEHNQSNVLSVLLILQALGLDFAPALTAIQHFAGLPHRMYLARERNGVRWINDSKATNIGATVAALQGATAPLILIVGGVGKGQDFSALSAVVAQSSVKQVLLIGTDSSDLAKAFGKDKVATENCQTLDKAVQYAATIAQAGDWVLLSPACASFDQFDNYEARGEYFVDLVGQL